MTDQWDNYEQPEKRDRPIDKSGNKPNSGRDGKFGNDKRTDRPSKPKDRGRG